MKTLQFKLDTIGAGIGCVGILLTAYAFYTAITWTLYGGVLLAVISVIIILSSGGITRFIEGNKE